MYELIWGSAAIVAGLAILWWGGRQAARSLNPTPGGPLPPTPLQRLARRGLLLGLVPSAGLAGLILYFGPDRTFGEQPVRLGFTLLLVLILAVFGFLTLRLRHWARGEGAQLDERDLAILHRSHGVRSVAILVTLAIWTIGLQERYWEVGTIPFPYLNLIFWSCLIVSLLAFPLGVLASYRD